MVECLDGFSIPFPAGQGYAQVVQAFRIIRFERKSFCKSRNRIIIFLPLGKGNAFIVQDTGIIGREFKGLVIGYYGLKGFPEAGKSLSFLEKCRGAPAVYLKNPVKGADGIFQMIRGRVCHPQVTP